jgi:RNA polymerase sigma-70 factor (sigma-E family)
VEVEPRVPATWDDVYRAQRDGLVRLAYLMTGSQALAEDLVQDCFVRVMGRLSPAGDPGPYLRRSVVNACYSWHRRDGRRSAGDVRWPEAATEQGSDLEMWDALNRLAGRPRAVLVLRFYLDLSEAETAAVLGCRPGTVKSATHRALADLRRILER